MSELKEKELKAGNNGRGVSALTRLLCAPFLWIRNLFLIVRDYSKHREEMLSVISKIDKQSKYASNVAEEAKNIIQERTEVSAEILESKYGYSHVILTGRYKGRDYVEVFSIRSEEFTEMVEILRDMQRHAHVKHIDGPIGLKTTFERELNWGI